MIPKGLLTQVAIIALSVGIVITYIKPTFDTIAAHQGEIEIYQEEQEKVRDVNTKLANLSAAVNAISVTDRNRLLTYMPDTVDTVAVPRTLEAIAKAAGVQINAISAGEGERQSSRNSSFSESGEMVADVIIKPTPVTFTMGIEATYDELKSFLTLVEQNEFPLEVTAMEVSKTETGTLAVEFIFTTYSHTEKPLVEDVSMQ